jgi:hypothetical protein
MSSDDALVLLQRIVQLEDVIAQYRHTAESMRSRLTELENLVNKVGIGSDGYKIADAPPTFVAYK